MNGVLRAAAQAVPKATIFRVVAGVGLGSAAGALGIAFLLRPTFGAVVGYVVWPLLAALLAWVVAGVLRLRLVGYLPSQAKDDDFIPRALQPWIRFWLLARFGLLGAMLAVVLAVVVTAVVGWGVNNAIQAFVYVVMVRMFMDVAFGAAFNLGIIARRRSVV
jgi:hypothetical protein